MWREWLPYDKASAVEGILAFEKFMVLMVRQGGAERLYVCRDTEKQKWEPVDVPEDEHSISLSDDIEYDAPFFRFAYQSAVTPRQVCDYHVEDKKLTVRKKQDVPRWDSNEYYSERVWVKSGNVKIPVSLAYHKKFKRDGKAPMLLDAYGSYGISSDPFFSIARAALLERGWIIATAHVRGGGEMGSSWHKAAYRMTKHRTYQDVIAVADYLVRNNYTSREKLAMTGGSAGGMTMGAVFNMRPDICAAAIVHVPNADTVNSMLDETLGGTRLHYDELGDPRKPQEFFYLKKWSPYENVRTADYPALLVRASFHDIRTPYWEAAKWVARLRAKKTDENPLLLKVELNAGHGGKSGRYAWIKERAFDYAFLIGEVEGK
jgi:oligopeptidase B